MMDHLRNKGQTFQWNEDSQRSFNRLKLAISIAPILLAIDPTKLFIIEIDASDTAISTDILLQGVHLISFKSKKQSCVAASTTEAEYVALWTATAEGLWLLNVIHQLGYLKDKKKLLYMRIKRIRFENT